MKKLSSLLCALALVLGVSAAPALPELNAPLAKSHTPRANAFALPLKAPAATLADDFSASTSYVEAAYYGEVTGDASDWVFYFVGTSNNLIAYIDVYDVADETHIDGTYQFSDGSIYEAMIVRAPGDTVVITSGSLTVQHVTSTNYHFVMDFYDATGATYSIVGDYDVDAYDYLNYYYGYYYGYCYDYGIYCDVEIDLEDAQTTGGGTTGGGTTGGGTGDGDTSDPFYYEPDQATSFTFTGDSFEAQDGTAQYGLVALYPENSLTEDWAELYFYNTVFYIPAGTYPINDSQTQHTFVASVGGDADYDYPSYVAIVDGQYYNPFYLVSGNITVAYSGNIMTLTGTATSAKGSIVTFNVSAESPFEDLNPADALENVDSEKAANKFIKDGQLLIEKNGKLYNALGTEMK